MKTVAVSGGFDPLHAGHLSFFEAAAGLGTALVVLVEPDEWVARKHPPLLTQEDRCRLIRQLRCVTYAEPIGPGGFEALARKTVWIDAYAVGADHADLDFPEAEACRRLGIEIAVVGHRDSHVHSRDLLAAWSRPKCPNPPVTVDALIGWHGKLLLIRRGRGDGEGMWDLPGGFVEEGEGLEEALAREVAEEVGADCERPEYVRSSPGVYPDGRTVLNVAFACGLRGEPRPTAEAAEVVWADRMPEGRWFTDVSRRNAEGFFP